MRFRETYELCETVRKMYISGLLHLNEVNCWQ